MNILLKCLIFLKLIIIFTYFLNTAIKEFPNLCIIFVFLKDLNDYIMQKNGKLSKHEAILVFTEIVDAFKEMYCANIIHRDIKP